MTNLSIHLKNNQIQGLVGTNCDTDSTDFSKDVSGRIHDHCRLLPWSLRVVKSSKKIDRPILFGPFLYRSANTDPCMACTSWRRLSGSWSTVQENLIFANEVYLSIQQSPLLAKSKFIEDIIYQHLPIEVKENVKEEKPTRHNIKESLWLTASTVLTNWMQDWISEAQRLDLQLHSGKSTSGNNAWFCLECDYLL